MRAVVFVSAALAIAAPILARAQEAAKSLTVEQAIGVGEGIRDLSSRATETGARVPLPPGTVKLPPRVTYQLATAAQKIESVRKSYEETTRAAIRDQFGEENPSAVAADPKRAAEYQKKNSAFQEEIRKALSLPSGAEIKTIRQSDLCLEAKPPECPQANPISVDTLTLLMPIVSDK